MKITYAEKESELIPFKVGDVIKTDNDIYLITVSNTLPVGQLIFKLVNMKTCAIVHQDFDSVSQTVEFFTKGNLKVEVFQEKDIELVIREGVDGR